MRTFECTCGNALFFDNSQCLRCGHAVGWCPACNDFTPLAGAPGAPSPCQKCGASLQRCHNYAVHAVCNRCLVVQEGAPPAAGALCDYCAFTATVPDLSVEGNQRRWYELEAAKRRLLYTLEELRLPIDGTNPPLSFAFKGDVAIQDAQWRTVGTAERVFTGHAGGRITINVEEADDDVRARMRVELDESHRTLVGHFHHEIGHYYWDLLVRPQPAWRQRFDGLFGDPDRPTYAQALKSYYQSPPRQNWQASYISRYATMHPWEDFAETFAAYLDMVAVLDTANDVTPMPTGPIHGEDLQSLLDRYTRLGVALNEMNRTLGLIDFLPDVFQPRVVDKLRFVHELVQEQSATDGPAS